MKQASQILFCFMVFGMQVRAQSGSDILKIMHTTYFKKVCKSYTFSQKNTHYKGDTISGQSVWHEAIDFPDQFRIDFGEKSQGNFILFRNDSALNYRKGSFVKARSDSNTLLLILGGMYYRSFDDVSIRLKNAGYDLTQLSSQTWKGESVYVIGAKEGDLISNQIWVNKKTLCVERILEKMNVNDIMDMRFESHTKLCEGFIENKVSFRRNGKLEQVEEYYDIKESH